MEIIDAHAHLFSEKIIRNVSRKSHLVELLHLEVDAAFNRLTISSLRKSCEAAGIKNCIILPTANQKQVNKINESFLEFSLQDQFFIAAATLHPYASNCKEYLEHLATTGISAIKLCSFSQGFSLTDERTKDLFRLITRINEFQKANFFVILDTFYLAHRYFGTSSNFTTEPKLLGGIVDEFPNLNIIAAHMGGLAAPLDEIVKYLKPAKNLYLDTSNAAYVLTEDEFLRLLDLHGPEHIIFGTDWPWFGHEREIEKIYLLLEKAGFTDKEKEKVFSQNILSLLSLTSIK